MNVKFYKKLLSFRTHSKSEVQIEFRNWLNEYILNNYDNVKTHLDEYGNLYVEKGSAETTNCVVAHLDINQRTKSDNIEILKVGEWILGIDKDTGLQIGLGHDDKAGVYFALQALYKFDNIKLFFPLDEEVGCVGSKNCNPTFFENVGFMVQLDRRGYTDISNYTNGNDVVTKETEEELDEVCTKYGYKFTRCVSTDVGYLVGVLDIQGVNISCGYYDEHSDKEVLNIYDYDNAEAFAISVLQVTNGKRYEIKQKPVITYPKTYGGYGGSYNRNYGTTTAPITPMTVHKGGVTNGTNANSHLIDRSKDNIDTYNKKPEFVNSSSLGYDDDFYDEYYGYGYRGGDDDIYHSQSEKKTLETKVKEFNFSWHQSKSCADEIALNDTEVLLEGYKDIVNYLMKETTISDNEMLEIFAELITEIREVEELGNHDLTDVKEYINTQKTFLISFAESQKNIK